MIRFLLWALIIYFAWRVIRSFTKIYSNSRRNEEKKNPLSNIEEAEFEDLTEKDKTKETKNPPGSN